MIWLTWRQSRLESLIGVVALALVATWLVWTGLEMNSAYDDEGLAACLAAENPDQACHIAVGDFLQRFNNFQGIMIVPPLCLPFLIGLLLAAPTVLDFEQGTYRLAWTQSITRRRWLATKIGIGLAVSVVVAIGLVAIWTWWRGPLDAINGRFDGGAFDFEGVVPIAYTVFAFALCLAAGTILRRAVPAIGIGLAGFVGVRAFVAAFVRSNYLDPKTVTWSAGDPPPAAVAAQQIANKDWIISDSYADLAGNVVSGGDPTFRACVGEAGNRMGDAIDSCLSEQGIVNQVVYHPASRYWLFQGIETALFLGLAAALLGLTACWVTRRIV
jgi:hypothetical protein